MTEILEFAGHLRERSFGGAELEVELTHLLERHTLYSILRSGTYF
jgi:hypothetical protein